MAPSYRTRKNLVIWIITTLLGGAIGVVYSLAVGGNPELAFPIGCFIVAGVMGFELFVVQQPTGVWLRRSPLPVFIMISTLVWVAIIAVCLQTIPLLLGRPEAYGDVYRASSFRQDMVFALVAAFVINAGLRIRSLVGGRVLLNFLAGRYHRPLREQRVFLFLDLADSTRLSEELGDVRVQSLIGRFFFDIAQPVAEQRGETHRYIGDEIVVTWPFSDAIAGARCIQCVLDIQDLMAARASSYQTEFGVVPQFRAGMHGGWVVASEIGDDKREIVYFGDTINTAARIQSLCKELKRNFLVSGELHGAMTLPAGASAEHMGEVALRGKAEMLDVYSLSRQVRTG